MSLRNGATYKPAVYTKVNRTFMSIRIFYEFSIIYYFSTVYRQQQNKKYPQICLLAYFEGTFYLNYSEITYLHIITIVGYVIMCK